MSVPSNLVPTRILQLPEDPSPNNTGWMMYVNNGVTYKVQVNSLLTLSGVSSVSGTSPIISSGGTTPVISIAQATTSTSGYLSSTDWNTFNSKGSGTVTSVAATSPLTSTGGATPTIAMPVATTSVSGYLSSTDWNTFNGKQAAGTYVNTVSGTAPIVSSGGATPAISITSSGANSAVLRDANQNIAVNAADEAFVQQAATTPITLTASSTRRYSITGSGGQTIQLPNATTLANGAVFQFDNNQSSGAITVNNHSGTLVVSVPSGGYVIVTLLSNATAAGSWDRHDISPSNVSWSTNTFDYAGSITSATWNGNTIAVNRGGTGLASLTAGSIPYGAGTSAYSSVAIGTAGQFLAVNSGGTAPQWTTFLPLANGGTGGISAPSANASIQSYTTTATAAGTTTLDNLSTYYQYFTGSTTQTIVMPVTSTTALGWSFHIANSSSGNLTVQSSGLNAIGTILPNVTMHITCINTTDTTAAGWDYGFTDFGTVTGTGSVVLNTTPSIANLISTNTTYIYQPTPTPVNATNTLTIAQLLTGIITTTSATAVSLTLPTGTLTDAGILGGALPINQAFEWVVINLGSSTGAVTIVAGATHTTVGALGVPILTSARFRTTKTAATTFVTYRVD